MNILDHERFDRLPDAMLFDLDNTLYAYDPAHAAGMEAVREKVRSTLSVSVQDFDKAFGQARQEVKARLKETAASHSRLIYMQRMLEIIGLGSQVLLALDLEQTYWRTFLGKARLFDEVRELLDDLRLAGIPSGVVTDLTAQIQFRKLVYFGLDSYFDCVVTSEEAGCEKPQATPFRMAVAKLQPRGDRVWMIGDNPVTDTRGGRQAINAVTLQKVHDGVEVGRGTDAADATFSQFADVRHLIAKLGDRS